MRDSGPSLPCASVARSGRLGHVGGCNRSQALGLELLRNVSVEPTRRRLVVVKSTNHFMAAYGPIASDVLYVDADGPIPRDYGRIP